MLFIKQIHHGKFLKKRLVLYINEKKDIENDIINTNNNDITSNENQNNKDNPLIVDIFETYITYSFLTYEPILKEHILTPEKRQRFQFIIYDAEVFNLSSSLLLLTSCGLYLFEYEKGKFEEKSKENFNISQEPKDILMYMEIDKKLELVVLYSNIKFYIVLKYDSNRRKFLVINDKSKISRNYIDKIRLLKSSNDSYFCLIIQSFKNSKIGFEYTKFMQKIEGKYLEITDEVKNNNEDFINFQYILFYEKLSAYIEENNISDIRNVVDLIISQSNSSSLMYFFLIFDNEIKIIKMISNVEEKKINVDKDFSYIINLENSDYINNFIEYKKINDILLFTFDNDVVGFKLNDTSISKLKFNNNEHKSYIINNNIELLNNDLIMSYNYNGDYNFFIIQYDIEKDVIDNKNNEVRNKDNSIHMENEIKDDEGDKVNDINKNNTDISDNNQIKTTINDNETDKKDNINGNNNINIDNKEIVINANNPSTSNINENNINNTNKETATTNNVEESSNINKSEPLPIVLPITDNKATTSIPQKISQTCLNDYNTPTYSLFLSLLSSFSPQIYPFSIGSTFINSKIFGIYGLQETRLGRFEDGIKENVVYSEFIGKGLVVWGELNKSSTLFSVTNDNESSIYSLDKEYKVKLLKTMEQKCLSIYNRNDGFIVVFKNGIFFVKVNEISVNFLHLYSPPESLSASIVLVSKSDKYMLIYLSNKNVILFDIDNIKIAYENVVDNEEISCLALFEENDSVRLILSTYSSHLYFFEYQNCSLVFLKDLIIPSPASSIKINEKGIISVISKNNVSLYKIMGMDLEKVYEKCIFDNINNINNDNKRDNHEYIDDFNIGEFEVCGDKEKKLIKLSLYNHESAYIMLIVLSSKNPIYSHVYKYVFKDDTGDILNFNKINKNIYLIYDSKGNIRFSYFNTDIIFQEINNSYDINNNKGDIIIKNEKIDNKNYNSINNKNGNNNINNTNNNINNKNDNDENDNINVNNLTKDTINIYSQFISKSNNIIIKDLYKFNSENAIRILEIEGYILVLTDIHNLYIFNVYGDIEYLLKLGKKDKSIKKINWIKKLFISSDDKIPYSIIIIACTCENSDNSNIGGVIIIYFSNKSTINLRILLNIKLPKPIYSTILLRNFLISAGNGVIFSNYIDENYIKNLIENNTNIINNCINNIDSNKEYNKNDDIDNNEIDSNIVREIENGKMQLFGNRILFLISDNPLVNSNRFIIGDNISSFKLVSIEIKTHRIIYEAGDIYNRTIGGIYASKDYEKVYVCEKTGNFLILKKNKEIFNIQNQVNLNEFFVNLNIKNDTIIATGILGGVYIGKIIDVNTPKFSEIDLNFLKDFQEKILYVYIKNNNTKNTVLIDLLLEICENERKELEKKIGIQMFNKGYNMIRYIYHKLELTLNN